MPGMDTHPHEIPLYQVDAFTRVEGDRDVLIGKLQERYGLARDQAEKQLDSFLSADKGQQRKAG